MTKARVALFIFLLCSSMVMEAGALDSAVPSATSNLPLTASGQAPQVSTPIAASNVARPGPTASRVYDREISTGPQGKEYIAIERHVDGKIFGFDEEIVIRFFKLAGAGGWMIYSTSPNLQSPEALELNKILCAREGKLAIEDTKLLIVGPKIIPMNCQRQKNGV